MHETPEYIVKIANESFRDVADQDYIAARLCYKNMLLVQFVWLSHQAIEKYLKAVLLYHNKSTREYGHSIDKLFKSVLEIPNMRYDFDDKTKDFLDYLSEHGPNRYLEEQHYTLGLDLINLDRAVWDIRRYCQPIDKTVRFPDGEVVDIWEDEISNIHYYKKKNKFHKFKIIGGYLERVLRKKKANQKDILIWKNLYFGKRAKHSVKITSYKSFINPTHFRYPQHFQELEKLVYFPDKVKKVLSKNNQG